LDDAISPVVPSVAGNWLLPSGEGKENLSLIKAAVTRDPTVKAAAATTALLEVVEADKDEGMLKLIFCSRLGFFVLLLSASVPHKGGVVDVKVEGVALTMNGK